MCFAKMGVCFAKTGVQNVGEPSGKRAKVGEGENADLSVPASTKALRKSISHEDLQTEVRGEIDTHDTRYFSMDGDGEHRSLWHDVNLFEMDAAGKPTGSLQFVCEIPKWTRKKVQVICLLLRVHSLE